MIGELHPRGAHQASEVAGMLDAVSVHPLPAPEPATRAVIPGKTRICFVGLENLPVISRQYNHHGIGGEQVQHTLLARALAKQGFEVSMVVADYGQAAIEKIDGVTLHRAHGLTEGIPVLRFLHPRLTGLWAALKRADADVYYVSCAGPQLGIAVAFARIHDKRVVFRIAHDADCDPRKLIIRLWRDKKIYEYGLRRADAVLAQSAQQARALKANYGLDCLITSMLVEPPEQQLAFDRRDVDVLWVNNLRPFKRPQLALDLARGMPHLRFHMIGGPQGGFEALYEDIAQQARQIPNLTFHGQVPYHDVNGYYERARVFINTSESEGFPNSYLQAWQRGAPTVAFFDPDGLIARAGLGAAVGTLEAMAIEVQRFVQTEGSWLPASVRCQSFMHARYGDATVLAPYLDAFARSAALR